DQNVTVQIQASKTLGRLPIQVWFTTTVTSGDSPFTYSWNFGDNRFSLEKDPVHIYSKEGFYKATVTVVDADGDIGTASINIDAEGKKALDSRSAVHVSDVSFVNDVISSGDTLDVIASFKNNAGQTVKDATITVSIPELGISQMAKQSKLKDGEKMSRLFYLDTPYYTQPGFYYVRAAFSANSGNVRRVVYREIQIK
ncbi:PKD domain-containing protein, partial [Candidatus Woesearchaeota archaeon]|nr:PKD domain-containing protein [Candidatus Woesearchaeota archaeon]